MQIGAIGTAYPTYVYNTNAVSAKSLNKVKAIPEDALQSKVGYGASENTNPLRPGETKDFVGIFASQMAMSRMNQARLMKDAPDLLEAQ